MMFWVECFYTMDKRKKLLREFKGLPKCDVTGLPQHLGEDQWWNQLVFCLHTPRTSHCHHCHRLFDHKLSVSESGYDMFLVHGWTTNVDRVYFLQIGMMVEMAGSPVNLDNLMNEGMAFAIDRFKDRIPNCPLGRCPVMIGRRKPAYNTIDKVMNRLDSHEFPESYGTHCCCECTLRFY